MVPIAKMVPDESFQFELQTKAFSPLNDCFSKIYHEKVTADKKVFSLLYVLELISASIDM